MGIESDQLVFDYLSKVGDLAQQRQLPSAERMRLVSELRGEIDRSRAGSAAGGDSPASVRRILARLGSPDEVVTAAGGTPPRPAAPGGAATGKRRRPDAGSSAPDPSSGTSGRWRLGGRREPKQPAGDSGRPGRGRTPESSGAGAPSGAVPRPSAPPVYEAVPLDETGAPSPRRPARAEGPGAFGSRQDWWQTDGDSGGSFGSFGSFTGAELVPGFTGGVEIPEMLKPPPLRPFDAREPEEAQEAEGAEGKEQGAGASGTGGGADAGGAAGPEGAAARPLWRRLLRRGAPAGGAGAASTRRWTNPLLLLAAALLLAGALAGNWFALALGWAIAYASRRLTAAESKWAVLFLPGLALVAGVVWLWGRQGDRWGEPIGQGHMSDAVTTTWPWVVRGAAVASALFLIWRSQRRS